MGTPSGEEKYLCNICGLDWREMAILGLPIIALGCGPSIERRREMGKPEVYTICGACSKVLGISISEDNKTGMIFEDLDNIDKRLEEIRQEARGRRP